MDTNVVARLAPAMALACVASAASPGWASKDLEKNSQWIRACQARKNANTLTYATTGFGLKTKGGTPDHNVIIRLRAKGGGDFESVTEAEMAVLKVAFKFAEKHGFYPDVKAKAKDDAGRTTVKVLSDFQGVNGKLLKKASGGRFTLTHGLPHPVRKSPARPASNTRR